MNLARVLAWPIGVTLFAMLGCSSPPKPPAQGAAIIKVEQNATGDACQATHNFIDVPAGDNTFNELNNCDVSTGCKPDNYVIVDGDQGQEVQCTVQSSGSGYQVQLLIRSVATKSAPVALTFSGSGTIPSTPTATGTFTLGSYDTLSQQSLQDSACTVTIAPNTGGVSPGKIWAQFDCESFQDPRSAATTGCAATGAFIFENCGGG